MYIKKYNRTKTNFVGHKTSDIEFFLSTPFAGTKKKSAQLTLRTQNTRLDLNSRQIKALREVLSAGYAE